MRCCSQLLALHRTAALQHDEYGQETLLNLLLRNYLHYNLYDQVSSTSLQLHCNLATPRQMCNDRSGRTCNDGTCPASTCNQGVLGGMAAQHRAAAETRGAAAAQAEKLRSKAQRPEVSRSTQQLCRHLYYLGRIRAIQLEYTDSKDCLQQALRKVRPAFELSLIIAPEMTTGSFCCPSDHAKSSLANCTAIYGSSMQSG